jgi:hypothetical protein
MYIAYIPVLRAVMPRLKRLLLVHSLPWMACMQALHRYMDITYKSNAGAIAEEQKPVTKKSGLIEVPFNLDQKQIDDYDFLPKQPQLELSNV